jgi:hypothetical protein
VKMLAVVALMVALVQDPASEIERRHRVRKQCAAQRIPASCPGPMDSPHRTRRQPVTRELLLRLPL